MLAKRSRLKMCLLCRCSDFFGEETEVRPLSQEMLMTNYSCQNWFVAPPPKEVEEVAVEDIEPVGGPGDIDRGATYSKGV